MQSFSPTCFIFAYPKVLEIPQNWGRRAAYAAHVVPVAPGVPGAFAGEGAEDLELRIAHPNVRPGGPLAVLR